MSGKFLTRVSALSLALLLVACGGDENSTPLAGNNNGSGQESTGGTDGSEPGSSTVEVGSLRLMTSQPKIGTGGENKATITVIVKDSNSVLVPDVDVAFSTVGNLGTLSVTQPTTSDAGIATANLSAAGDPRNRNITVQATAGNKTETISIPATGTNLSISGPSSLALDDTATFTITLIDSDNRGIEGQTLNVTSDSNSVLAGPVTTNASGVLQVQVKGQTSGDATLSASAFDGEFKLVEEKTFSVSGDSFQFTPLASSEVPLGTNENLTLNWSINGAPTNAKSIQFSTTRGIFQSTGKSVASIPTAGGKATVSISSHDAGVAKITATSSDTGVSTTYSMEFVATKPASLKLNASRTQIVTGETSNISATVKDAAGNLVKNATVIFTLEDVTSGQLSRGSDITDSQGLARTTYTASETTSEKDGVAITVQVDSQPPVAEQTITLTVGGQALTIIIGTGNTISAVSETFYNQPWGILVTDANGNASANQEVELSVLPTEYRQGIYVDLDPTDSYDWAPDSPTTTCTPKNADPSSPNEAISNPASSPVRVVTDADGKFEFNINYTKSQCNWASVKLTATARVDGIESQSSQTFPLLCLADDLKTSLPPGGITSFYGDTGDCVTPK